MMNIRTPLRPLARILDARAKGVNPDLIEAENTAARHDAMRARAKTKADWRLSLIVFFFVVSFTAIGGRMAMLSASSPQEPQATAKGAEILAQRADITDRNGRILATNMLTHALYAHPKAMVDPEAVAQKLAQIFPDMDAATLTRQFTDGRKFLWLRRTLSPEQMQAVHDIGDPGLLFGPREMRAYPNGALAAHILGGYSFGAEGVNSAEVIGVAGIEKAMDQRLRDPAQAGEPLTLSLDLTVQATVEEVLDAGMKMMSAKGASAIVMDVNTGEIIAMASLPDFDPNDRPSPVLGPDAEPSDSPIFNRAVQGVYELGSTYKIFAAAQAMELGLMTPDTMVDANAPMVWGKYKIKEFDNKNYGPLLSVADVIAKSSNVGTAHIALEIGGLRQQQFLSSLGLFEPVPVELVEAPTAKPLLPERWSEIVTITASYGHGVSASPLHLAAAYSTIANGGIKVTPTLLRRESPMQGPRVMREDVAKTSIAMLRRVVTEGTATLGDVQGYEVAGKTGTADKPKAKGGYYEDKVINTFASVFPASNPRYTVLVTLYEPKDPNGDRMRETAGWTAVPVASEMIRRIAPLLGLRPVVDPALQTGVTAVSN